MDLIIRYHKVIGISLLTAVAVLLLTSSANFFSPGVTFIDTQLNTNSKDRVFVRTKMDFGSQEHMAAFPMQMGEWNGSAYDTSKWEELLGTDLMVMRGYTEPGIYQPIFFLLTQAKTTSSFHSPNICYTSQGYDITETAKDSVTISSAEFADQWLTKDSGAMVIPVEKLVVVKKAKDGHITERRVVLHFYVKGNQFTTDTITWVRMEALAPIEGSYDGILDVEKQFLGEAIPLMFDPAEKKEWNPIARELAHWGIEGYLIIVFLLSVPLTILILPKTPWARHLFERRTTTSK